MGQTGSFVEQNMTHLLNWLAMSTWIWPEPV